MELEEAKRILKKRAECQGDGVFCHRCDRLQSCEADLNWAEAEDVLGEMTIEGFYHQAKELGIEGYKVRFPYVYMYDDGYPHIIEELIIDHEKKEVVFDWKD